MCTQEHTRAHSYSLLHHSPYERLFCRHPVSLVLHSCLTSFLVFCPTLWLSALCHRRPASSFYRFSVWVLKSNSLGQIRLTRRELCSEWRGAAASPRLHIPTQSEPQTHTKTHTPKLTSFYLYIFSDLCNKLLAFGSVHTRQRRLFCAETSVLCREWSVFQSWHNYCLYFSVYISVSPCILGMFESTDGNNVCFLPQGWRLPPPLSNNGGWAGVWIWRDVPRADGQVSLQPLCPADAVHRWPTNPLKYAPLQF